MSHSYRKPYSAVTGHSDPRDKRVARRNVRRVQDSAIRQFHGDWEDFVLPQRLECPYNDVWSWSRDGIQHLRYPPDYSEISLRYAYASVFEIDRLYDKRYKYYLDLCRK